MVVVPNQPAANINSPVVLFIELPPDVLAASSEYIMPVVVVAFAS